LAEKELEKVESSTRRRGWRRLLRELRWVVRSPLRTLAAIGGLLFLLAGLVGLFLPIVPQIPFFLLGLALLAGVSPRVRLFRDRLKARFRKWREKRRR
jgi:hypothetical protein